MRTLAELIREHSITAVPVYVDSVDGSPTRQYDHDLYDVLLIIETGIGLYGGSENPRRRTMLVQGYGQSPSNSLPQTGGNLVPPTAEEVLESLLSAAGSVDGHDTWQDWVSDYISPEDDGGLIFREMLKAPEAWQAMQEQNSRLRTFLGSAYEEFTVAAE